MMSGISLVALLTSFAAGLVSFLSPCVLPLVPGYVSYIAGQSLSSPARVARKGTRFSALGLSALFVLGFSTVFVSLGASATALGQLLLSYRYEANLIGGGLVILFGLLMIGMVRWPLFQRDFRFHIDIPGGRPIAAYVLGLAFAFGWSPCIGPVLGTILTASAVSATVSQGILLLSVYSLGLGLPFLVTAILTARVMARFTRLRRFGRALQFGAGTVVAVMGIAMITGELTTFSAWLLESLPGLARIG